ncbi:MAG: energy-coupling factor transporter transmembrane protein EcfT [Lachnospiraceae bacterium]|nr:energy-coupling factor transporter transmembrane protein EcfT [Lachnospiraceae bacterium]
MLRDITLGQYYHADSLIHRLDPRTKLAGTLIFIISLFLFKNVAGFIAITAFLFSVIKLSKVPFRYMVRGMKSIVILMLITVIFNLFLSSGVPILRIWKLTITDNGLEMAILTVIRLMYLIIGASILTLTTTPNNLTDGLEKAMSVLKVFHVPVHEIAMMMSIALRFIPILLEETDKIMKAQMARGADFEHGNIIKKAKSLVPILVPLFISAFRRANDLAMAMEARCYRGGSGRTKMKPLVYKKRDAITYIVLFVFLGLVIYSRGIHLGIMDMIRNRFAIIE